MNIGSTELLILLFILGFIIVPIWGVIDAAVRPESQWREADQNRVVWIVLQLIGGIIGAIAYFATIRPKLKAAQTRRGPSG